MNWIIGILVLVLCFIIIGALIYVTYTPYNKISIKESIDLANLPIITLINNEKKFNFLLDTGSNRSIINETDLKDCEFKELEVKNSLSGLDGIEREVKNVLLPVSYKSSNYLEIFQVSDMSAIFDDMKSSTGVTVNGILGNSFFEKYQYVIDFKDLVAYSKKKL